MRISDDARECSVFIGSPVAGSNEKELTGGGTGFLVALLGEGPENIYLVTAAHVAKPFEDAPFGVRYNTNQGEADIDYIDLSEWVFHPDKNVDIAVTPYNPPVNSRCMILPNDEFITDEKIKYFDIGEGDPVQIVGLFHLHSGKRKNLPVVHTGHIALSPTDDPMPTGTKETGLIWVKGYLVEVHALPGSSGSPAYVRATIPFLGDDFRLLDSKSESATLIHANSRTYLLGVWIGAWFGEPTDEIKLPSRNTVVPVGMGIVIPASKILEVLNLPKLKEARQAATMAQRDRKAATFTSVSASAPRASGENPTHLEDFNRLLGAASQKPKQAD